MVYQAIVVAMLLNWECVVGLVANGNKIFGEALCDGISPLTKLLLHKIKGKCNYPHSDDM